MGTWFLKAAQTAPPVPGSPALAWPASERGSLCPQAFSLNAKAMTFWPAQMTSQISPHPKVRVPQPVPQSPSPSRLLASPQAPQNISKHPNVPPPHSPLLHQSLESLEQKYTHHPNSLLPIPSTKPASCLCPKPPRLLPLLSLLCISLRALEHKPFGHHSPPSYLPLVYWSIPAVHRYA